jgi:hypothetical protein
MSNMPRKLFLIAAEYRQGTSGMSMFFLQVSSTAEMKVKRLDKKIAHLTCCR